MNMELCNSETNYYTHCNLCEVDIADGELFTVFRETITNKKLDTASEKEMAFCPTCMKKIQATINYYPEAITDAVID